MRCYTLFFLALFFMLLGEAHSAAERELISPFPSTQAGLSIPNAHALDTQNGLILRGMRPRTKNEILELRKLGVSDVLVFRATHADDTSTQEEMSQLVNSGINSKHLFFIPFPWKEMKNDSITYCLQTLAALRLMHEIAQDKSRSLFFHCTVGEDRTGYLAALYRIFFHQWSFERAWKEEMCAHGYADGNPEKPAFVTKTIHKNITPLFHGMLSLVSSGKLSSVSLDDSVCYEKELLSPLPAFKRAFNTCKTP